jgi:putative ABC transport system permease protein
MNSKLVTGYISQDNLERDFHKTEDVFIQLNLATGANAQAIEPAIKDVKRNYPQFTMISGRAFYEQNRKLLQVAFSAIYLVFSFLAIPSLIAMLNTLAIGVIERTREIGMLRAVGAAQSQVKRMILAEALLLAAVGTAFGLLAGLYLGYVMIIAFKASGFPVEFYFPWGGLIAAITIGLLFGMLAAIIPARQAAKVEIVTALRYE